MMNLLPVIGLSLARDVNGAPSRRHFDVNEGPLWAMVVYPEPMQICPSGDYFRLPMISGMVTKMLGSQQNRVAQEFLGCYRNVMNRRQFLQQTGIAGASLAAAAPFSLLSGCAARRNAASAANRHYAAPDISFIGGACGLPPVHVSADREIRTVVGLRPYRPSGFVVRGEKLDDTLVIHNYGHGGGGITLSWGTAKLGLDLGLPGHTGPVAVLGCGAVGLATARLLQEAGAAVTIYAKDLPPNTTSNIAGGQWFPAFVSQPEKRTALFNQ
jgi:FAD dependent oxidoreductase